MKRRRNSPAALVATVLPYALDALGRSLASFKALPREQQREQVRAILNSRAMYLTGFGPLGAIAARKFAGTPALVDAVVDAIAGHGEAAVSVARVAAVKNRRRNHDDALRQLREALQAIDVRVRTTATGLTIKPPRGEQSARVTRATGYGGTVFDIRFSDGVKLQGSVGGQRGWTYTDLARDLFDALLEHDGRARNPARRNPPAEMQDGKWYRRQGNYAMIHRGIMYGVDRSFTGGFMAYGHRLSDASSVLNMHVETADDGKAAVERAAGLRRNPRVLRNHHLRVGDRVEDRFGRKGTIVKTYKPDSYDVVFAGYGGQSLRQKGEHLGLIEARRLNRGGRK